jgi:histidinol-phosphate/aromatic aminotransferase/cobyric acid decarboxylase-like protein
MANRDQWQFEYTASVLAEGARKQKEYRDGRVAAWTEAKKAVMDEIKESGLEVSESVAAGMTNYAKTSNDYGPQVMVRADLQRKLTECHEKIKAHQRAAEEYDGWVQVLSANPESRQKLTQADWLYFFGKV